MKKYWWVYRTSLRRFVEYRSELFIDLTGKLLVPIVVQIFLWSAIFESDEQRRIGGYLYSEMIRYVCMGILISTVMKVERIEREIAAAIRDGDLNRFLIKPIDFMAYQFSVYLADVTPVLLGFVGLSVAASGAGWMTSDPRALIAGGVTLILGMYLAYMMGFLVALAAFIMDEVWTLFVMKGLIFWFLTGQILPLDFLPSPLYRVLSVLPFQFLSYFPAKAFLGQFSPHELGYGSMLALLWSIIFFGLYKLIWRLSIHRYGAYGG